MTKKRIDWIDIAKGIAIILMIIGHTKLLPKSLISLIFSFHMPLFIVLSGVTFKIPNNKENIKINIKKYVKRLLIPYIITVFICFFIHIIQTNNLFNFKFLIKDAVKWFLWGNGCAYTFFGHNFEGIGPAWFLITLFFSKILFDYINLYLKDKNNKMVVFSFLLLLGLEIGMVSWLPQGFDLVLVFLFYLYIGYWYQNEFKHFRINKAICFVVAFLIWTICLGFKLNIELAMRNYPYSILSVVESLCGCYCVIELCKIIADIKWLKKVFSFIGELSLIILCIHSIEQFLIDWQVIKINIFIICIIRVILNILLAVLVYYIKCLIINSYNKNLKKELNKL